MNSISVAYSPDTDDAFMVYAMQNSLIDTGGFTFTYVKDDIQKLNEEATKASYDVTAISVAAYPFIADEYSMMPVGASIGDAYGPSIIVKNSRKLVSLEDLQGKTIAVPGLMTSAYFALVALIGKFEARSCYFAEIENLVESGEVDAGLLIHEPQIATDSSRFRKIGDLGQFWFEKYQLPLPLGANAIRKSLGIDAINQLTQIYRNSIQYGLNNRDSVLSSIRNLAVSPLSMSLADDYISRYVNHRSLEMGDDVSRAISVMYQEGSKHGLCRDMKAHFAYGDNA